MPRFGGVAPRYGNYSPRFGGYAPRGFAPRSFMGPGRTGYAPRVGAGMNRIPYRGNAYAANGLNRYGGDRDRHSHGRRPYYNGFNGLPYAYNYGVVPVLSLRHRSVALRRPTGTTTRISLRKMITAATSPRLIRITASQPTLSRALNMANPRRKATRRSPFRRPALKRTCRRPRRAPSRASLTPADPLLLARSRLSPSSLTTAASRSRYITTC